MGDGSVHRIRYVESGMSKATGGVKPVMQLWEARSSGTNATILRVRISLCMQHEYAIELQRGREESRAQMKKTETDEGD
jgi:hypothetical protein